MNVPIRSLPFLVSSRGMSTTRADASKFHCTPIVPPFSPCCQQGTLGRWEHIAEFAWKACVFASSPAGLSISLCNSNLLSV
jgi:hypothetical protein